MKRVLLAVVIAAAIIGIGATTASAVTFGHVCSPGPADCSGWHNTPVTLTWTWSPDVTADRDCAMRAQETIATDGINTRSCSFVWSTGSAVDNATIKVDRTRPVVTGATVSRPPDHDGWYRAPVQVTFSGTDASTGSGLVGCSNVTYAGPAGDPAHVIGTCSDVAGNVSRPFPFPIRFDATPPALAAPTARTGDRVVRVRWQPPPDAASIRIIRSPGRHGHASSVVHRGAGKLLVDRKVRNGRHYQYTLRAHDAAGNVATATVSAAPGRRLLSPVGGAVVTTRPRLSWTRIRGARYYNVQVYRRGHKVLSAWPRRAHLKLRSHWRYAGRRHHLKAGRYRWYVWPGRGRPSQRRFGSLIGRAEFVYKP